MAQHAVPAVVSPALEALPRPAGRLDWCRPDGGGWRVGGWMAPAHGGPPDEIRTWWNGEELGLAWPTERKDLDDHLYWIRRPRRCGFRVDLPDHDAVGRLELVGRRKNRDIAGLGAMFIAPQMENAPLPPDALALRVSDLCGDSFRLSGLQAFTDLWDQMARHAGDRRQLAVLDWGCGCGRVARYLAWAGVRNLFGCDIDAEAVSWCGANLPGDFRHSSPEPSLPFDDSAVDVVLAGSVFTHLDRQQQREWLGELRRIMAPQGLLIASVAGEYTYTLGRSKLLRAGDRPGSLRAQAIAVQRRVRLRRAGIIDHNQDPHLDGIAPPAYYKMVYQTRDFIARAWTSHFEIESYIERGLAGHQDLVVLRPR